MMATPMKKLCTVLKPLCVAATIAMLPITLAFIWGGGAFAPALYWKLAGSYAALLILSFVIFAIDNPPGYVRPEPKG